MIQDIHNAIKGHEDTLRSDGQPVVLPETVYCPADIYDTCVDQARQFYPTVKFVREPDFEAFLTVAPDPLDVN